MGDGWLVGWSVVVTSHDHFVCFFLMFVCLFHLVFDCAFITVSNLDTHITSHSLKMCSKIITIAKHLELVASNGTHSTHGHWTTAIRSHRIKLLNFGAIFVSAMPSMNGRKTVLFFSSYHFWPPTKSNWPFTITGKVRANLYSMQMPIAHRIGNSFKHLSDRFAETGLDEKQNCDSISVDNWQRIGRIQSTN